MLKRAAMRHAKADTLANARVLGASAAMPGGALPRLFHKKCSENNSREGKAMRKRGTIRRVADELDVDQATVRRALAASGREPSDSEISYSEAVEIVNDVADPGRIVSHAATRGRANTELSAARARFEELKARKLEIENQKAEGALISREAVTVTGAHIIATARTALLSLGYRLAEKVAGNTDVREITRIVEAEVQDVLGALADESQFFAALEADALS
jgi:hypothetical protein